MGKLTVKDAEDLLKSEILSEESIAELQSKGMVSKQRQSAKRFIKTADNKWVEPKLYFRGAKGVEKIIEIKLNDEEKKNFQNSIKSVQGLFVASTKIDKDLS